MSRSMDIDDILQQFKNKVLDTFIKEIQDTFPQKAFGYFLASSYEGPVKEYIIFKDNIRKEYNELFEKYGNYYVTNNAGFVSTPEETFKVEKYIQKNKLVKVGVFHSHQRHPALLSSIDADLHPDQRLWHLLISLRNPLIPRIKIFSVINGEVRELEYK